MRQKRKITGGNVRLRNKYSVVVQGLFCGVEWTLYRNGIRVAMGESESMDEGLTRARAFVLEEMHKERKAI